MPEQDVEIRVKYDQPRVGVATNGRTNKKGTVKIEDDISGVDIDEIERINILNSSLKDLLLPVKHSFEMLLAALL